MKVTVPPLKALVPNGVAPSMKVTVPLAAAGETVAVRVTLFPKMEGFRLEASVVVVGGANTGIAIAACATVFPPAVVNPPPA